MKRPYTFLWLFLLTRPALADITDKAYVTDGDNIKISGQLRARRSLIGCQLLDAKR
jgi:hypothetical protein